jgi:hypothetical protein
VPLCVGNHRGNFTFLPWQHSDTTEYESVSKSFRTGLLEQELQMVQLSATRCSCFAILWVSIVSFAATTLCVASQRVFIVVSVYFVIDSVRKLLNTPSSTSFLATSSHVGRKCACWSTADVRLFPMQRYGTSWGYWLALLYLILEDLGSNLTQTVSPDSGIL